MFTVIQENFNEYTANMGKETSSGRIGLHNVILRVGTTFLIPTPSSMLGSTLPGFRKLQPPIPKAVRYLNQETLRRQACLPGLSPAYSNACNIPQRMMDPRQARSRGKALREETWGAVDMRG